MSLHLRPRRWTPRQLRWLMCLYPPYLFQRIVVREVDADFRRAVVVAKRSFMSRNLQGSTFGGTIYSAVDPFHALLLWQICAREGIRVEAWMKRATTVFLRPAATDLTFEFVLDEPTVEAALAAVRDEGRFAKIFRVEGHDADGTLCATVETDVRIISAQLARERRAAKKAAS